MSLDNKMPSTTGTLIEDNAVRGPKGNPPEVSSSLSGTLLKS